MSDNDKKNIWKQLVNLHVRKSEENNGLSTNTGWCGPSRIMDETNNSSSSRDCNFSPNCNGMRSESNIRERLTAAVNGGDCEDDYGRLFHGSNWAEQPLEVLEGTFPTDPSASSRCTAGSTSSADPNGRSSNTNHKNLRSSREDAGTSTLYFGNSLHSVEGGANDDSGSHPLPLNESYPHATMKLGTDSESDEDSLDLYLEYYRQSVNDEQQDNRRQPKGSPRNQVPGSLTEGKPVLPQAGSTASTASKNGGSGLKLGIIDMLEHLQSLTRSRVAISEAVRHSSVHSSTFGSSENELSGSSIPHCSLGMYGGNENNMIVAQQYAEWEKEMEQGHDSDINMDFYFDSGDVDRTLPYSHSDLGSTSRDFESLSLQDSRLETSAAAQRRAASRFGLSTGLGQFRCDYSASASKEKDRSGDESLIMVADNPRGYSPGGYFEAPEACGGGGPTVYAEDEKYCGLKDELECTQEVGDIPVMPADGDSIRDNEGDSQAGHLQLGDSKLDRSGSDAVINDEPGEPVKISKRTCEQDHEDDDDYDARNPFITDTLSEAGDTGCSPPLRQTDDRDNNDGDKIHLKKVAGIRAGLKHIKRRLSSCFVPQR